MPGVAELHADGVLDDRLLRGAVAGLLAASTLARSPVALASGGHGFGLRVAGGLALMTLAAVLAIVLS